MPLEHVLTDTYFLPEITCGQFPQIRQCFAISLHMPHEEGEGYHILSLRHFSCSFRIGQPNPLHCSPPSASMIGLCQDRNLMPFFLFHGLLCKSMNLKWRVISFQLRGSTSARIDMCGNGTAGMVPIRDVTFWTLMSFFFRPAKIRTISVVSVVSKDRTPFVLESLLTCF